ncbi:MAG: DegT/DnrJ/EryC1/StrS family aminotransferase [Clostridium sp.]|nr:DegT/DnrJ/EryC1/StrS family aminotransferase [Clostridium sp.]
MEFGSVIELDNNKYYIDCGNSIHRIDIGYGSDFNQYFFQSGRNAIEALMLFLHGESNVILVPDFVCETVKDAILRADWMYVEYNVHENMKIDVCEINRLIMEQNFKYVYISHLFDSRFSDDDIKYFEEWKKDGITVIEDVTLNLLATDKIGFGSYIIGSFRKWFAIPDGAFLFSKNKITMENIKDGSVYTSYYLLAQTLKREYINGGYEDSELKKLYLEYYGLSMNDIFSDYTIKGMSHISKVYMSNINITEIRKLRQENYDFLYEQISEIDTNLCVSKRSNTATPMMLVVKCDNRDELLNRLIEHDIYCSVHWRLSSDKPNVKYLSSHLLSIPCDQRYTSKQLQYIVDCLNTFKEQHIF